MPPWRWLFFDRRTPGRGIAVAAFVLAIGCKSMGRDILDMPAPPADARLHYGPDPFEFGDLRVPKGAGPHKVAIVIHGGFWRAKYNLEHIGHLCEALRRAGIATWSLEYRRVGNPGGGWPGTFQDVAMGADYLREIAPKYHLDLAKVIAVGHSAGGQLAVWLAARQKIPAGDPLWSANPLKLRGAVALAGVVDLRLAWKLHLGNGAVEQLMGGPPDKLAARYRTASPVELMPIGVRVRLVHGTDDSVVPIQMSNEYQKAAGRAGDDARMIVLGGADHFTVIDPRSIHWSAVESAIQSLLE